MNPKRLLAAVAILGAGAGASAAQSPGGGWVPPRQVRTWEPVPGAVREKLWKGDG